MSIRQSLLALLSEQPRYGYELKTEFDDRTGHTWPLNIGQVYTTLDRLERDGLVDRGASDEQGRVSYTITEAGRAEVSDWFANPVVMNNPPRNELAIKIAIAATVPGVDVTALIQTQRRASIHALQSYTQARHRARTQSTGTGSHELAWRLVIESLITATEAEVRWLDLCESTAVQASRAAQAAPSPTSQQEANQQEANQSARTVRSEL